MTALDERISEADEQALLDSLAHLPKIAAE